MEAKSKKPKVSDEIQERLSKLEKSLWVTRINGKTENVHISQLVLEDHERLKSVEKNTAILADFNKVHAIFKKYKIYYLILFGILIYFGIDVKTLVTKLIMGHL